MTIAYTFQVTEVFDISDLFWFLYYSVLETGVVFVVGCKKSANGRVVVSQIQKTSPCHWTIGSWTMDIIQNSPVTYSNSLLSLRDLLSSPDVLQECRCGAESRIVAVRVTRNSPLPPTSMSIPDPVGLQNLVLKR